MEEQPQGTRIHQQSPLHPRRTPDAISRARQKIRQEMEVWRAAIRAAQIALDPSKAEEITKRIEYGQKHVVRLEQAMLILNRKAKAPFWR
jgi:hypothetical protein